MKLYMHHHTISMFIYTKYKYQEIPSIAYTKLLLRTKICSRYMPIPVQIRARSPTINYASVRAENELKYVQLCMNHHNSFWLITIIYQQWPTVMYLNNISDAQCLLSLLNLFTQFNGLNYDLETWFHLFFS